MPGRKEPASTDHTSNPAVLHSNLRSLCCRTPSRAHTHHVALNHDGRQANAISTAPHEAGPFIGPGTPRDGSHDPHARPRSRHESALLGQAHVRRLQRREAEGQSLCHLQEEPAAQAEARLNGSSETQLPGCTSSPRWQDGGICVEHGQDMGLAFTATAPTSGIHT